MKNAVELKKKPMKAFCTIALCAYLGTIVGAQAQSDSQPQVVRLADSAMILASLDLNRPRFINCQPLRGEAVAVLDMTPAPIGLPGSQVAHIRILEGRCQNVEGWVGLEHLSAH